MNETKKVVRGFTVTHNLCLSGILIALGVVGSMFSFPVLGAKCAPVQHIINVIAGATLGPFYSMMIAFITSLIRNLFGIGSLLAFPGSMVGAFLAGLCCNFTKNVLKKMHKTAGVIGFLPLFSAFFGEIFGTGILGGILACPIAVLFGINPDAAIFSFVIPFLISTVIGSAIALLFLITLHSTKAWEYGKQ